MFNLFKKILRKGSNQRTIKVPAPAVLHIKADGPFGIYGKDDGYFYGPYHEGARAVQITNFCDELVIKCDKTVRWQVLVKGEKGEYVNPRPVELPLELREGQSTEDTVRAMFAEQKLRDYYESQGKEVLQFEDFVNIEEGADQEEREFVSNCEMSELQEEYLRDYMYDDPRNTSLSLSDVDDDAGRKADKETEQGAGSTTKEENQGGKKAEAQ